MGTPSPLLRVVYDEAKSGGLTPDQASRRVAASDTITLLSHPTNPLCKTWRADGTIDPYANGKYFTHREEAVDGIASLSALLSSLEGDHNTCVIRGRYVGDETAAMRDPEHKAGLVRRIRDIYEDIPHQWMLTEVDDFEPLAADPAADPLAAIEEFIATRLPDPFRGASYHWQLSNSAGAELRLEYRAGVFVLLEGDAETQQESLAAIKPILRKAVETFIGRKLSVSHESTARNYLLRRMEDEGMLEGIPERTARRALGEMIDAGELIPKTTMPWFNSSRHRVQGLGVAE